MPFNPIMPATAPSFIQPSPERLVSSQCDITGISNISAYISARRISPLSDTGRPSSETATTPANFIAPISASSVPFKPFETAPIGNTFTYPDSFALLITYDITASLSITGSVFGIQATEVIPPASADFVPVSISSLYS